MNTTQAIVILKNGMRKYGSILNSELKNQTVIFVPGAETFRDGPFDHLIEYIPLDEIEGIDTYLK